MGLIVVSFAGKGAKAEVICHPEPFNRRKNKRRREMVLKEIDGRSADFNVGGSNRTKIMTAYKENCVQIACFLNDFGALSPRILMKLGTGNKTSSILTKNYYGWFERIKRGTYMITEKGKLEIKEFPDLIEYYKEKISSCEAFNIPNSN